MICALDLVEKAVVLSFEVVTLFLQLGAGVCSQMLEKLTVKIFMVKLTVN